LVPVLDSFDMALAATNKAPDKATQSLQAGINMIYQQLKSALAEVGLQEIDATGKPFDPAWHEAVSEQATADVAEGHVVQQLRKGYKLHDRLLRPAGVVVARRPTDKNAANTAEETVG
jgi:molecular chaperone GrpE